VDWLDSDGADPELDAEEAASMLSGAALACRDGPFFEGDTDDDRAQLNRTIMKHFTKDECYPGGVPVVSGYTMVDLPSKEVAAVTMVKPSRTESQLDGVEVRPTGTSVAVLKLYGYCSWCSSAVRAPVELGASF
jgi:hypothetical protein